MNDKNAWPQSKHTISEHNIIQSHKHRRQAKRVGQLTCINNCLLACDISNKISLDNNCKCLLIPGFPLFTDKKKSRTFPDFQGHHEKFSRTFL